MWVPMPGMELMKGQGRVVYVSVVLCRVRYCRVG